MAQPARAKEVRRRPGEDAAVALHLPLVRQVACQFAAALPPSIELEEIVSWGVEGLLDALRRWEEDGRASFATYARVRIRGAILDELRGLDWVSRTGRERATRIEDGRRNLEHRLGRRATEEEVAEEIGIELSDLQRWMGTIGDLLLVSIDDPSTAADRLGGLPNSDEPDPFDVCAARRRAHDLRSAIGRLAGKERDVVPLYYSGDLTMKEVGARLGVTESRVCQLHGQALVRLREMLAAWAPEQGSGH